MKRIAVLVLCLLIFAASYTISFADAELPSEWPGMTSEEKIEHCNHVLMEYIAESEFHQKVTVSYSQEYYLLVHDTLIQEFSDKYDIAFKKKTRINEEFLLFDFDENDFVLMYKREYGRHYGKFTGTEKGDWTLLKNEDPFIDGFTVRNIKGKLYYISEKEKNDSKYVKCEMEEPLKYLFN